MDGDRRTEITVQYSTVLYRIISRCSYTGSADASQLKIEVNISISANSYLGLISIFWLSVCKDYLLYVVCSDYGFILSLWKEKKS